MAAMSPDVQAAAVLDELRRGRRGLEQDRQVAQRIVELGKALLLAHTVRKDEDVDGTVRFVCDCCRAWDTHPMTWPCPNAQAVWAMFDVLYDRYVVG